MSTLVNLNKATNRNTDCHFVCVMGVSILFSYQTPVGFWSSEGKVRRDNCWGPTTGRHLKEGNFYDAKVLDEAEFNQRLDDTILKAALVRLTGSTS